MQYSWAVIIVALMLGGTTSAAAAAQRKGLRNGLSAKIQFGTTSAIFLVLLHNIFWERAINESLSKGWTFLYTFPTFLICFPISLLLAVTFTIRARRLRLRELDQSENTKAEPERRRS